MKKPFVVTISLVFIYVLAFFAYLGVNIGFTYLTNVALSFIGFVALTHVISMLWCLVIMSNKHRRIETKIRWTAFICFVPFFGIVSYILFGRPYKYKKHKAYLYKNDDHKKMANIDKTINTINDLKSETPEFKRAFITSFKQQNEQVYKDFKLKYFPTGSQYFIDLLNELNNAKSYILLNIYIIQEGELLDQISNIIFRKLKQGVKVYLVYDFIGSYNRFRKTKKKWKKAGVEVVGYSPVHFPFIFGNTNYRDHRKDIVIDGQIGYIGGMNISDDYCSMGQEFGIWDDAAYKIIGSPVKRIENIFKSDWNFYKKKYSKRISLPIYHTSEISSGNDFAQIVSSGPNHATPVHLDVLLSLINSAQKMIWIKTPYFIPPPELIDALCQASNSGLDVRLILPGKTDKAMILDVSKNKTNKLFENGVKIYSVNNTFAHEKSYIFDNDISFVGTTNLDYRALFSDQQTMLLVKSKELNRKIKNKMKITFDISELYSQQPTKGMNLIKRLLIKIYNIIAPIL